MRTYGAEFKKVSLRRRTSDTTDKVDIVATAAHTGDGYNWSAVFSEADGYACVGQVDAIVDTQRRSDGATNRLAKLVLHRLERFGFGVDITVRSTRDKVEDPNYDAANFTGVGSVGIDALVLAAMEVGNVGRLGGTVRVEAEPTPANAPLLAWAQARMSEVSGVTTLPNGTGYKLPAAAMRAVLHVANPDLVAHGTQLES